MEIFTLIAVLLLVISAESHQIELLEEDHNVTQTRGISGRMPISGQGCDAIGTVCDDSNPCKTGAGNVAGFETCLKLKDPSGAPKKICLPTEYCYEPNPAVRGKAACTLVRPVGCNAVDDRECAGNPNDASRRFCLNNSPCVLDNSIRRCSQTGFTPATQVQNCNDPANGYVGCIDEVGGQPKCIKQVPWYCPNAVPFMCTGTGFYPNAYNCRSYFQCTSPGNAGIAKQCPNGQVFDPMANNNGNQCKVSNGINGCIEAQCGAGAGNILLNYPGYSKSYGSYAVVCGGQQPAVYRCEDGFQPNLDTFPIVCTGTCPGSNKRAVDPANPNGYYSCSTSNGKHVGAQRVCPGAQNAAGVLVSQLYNRETKKCE